MTLIKQEKLMFILVILYCTFGSIYVLLQNCTQVSENFKFRVSGSRNHRKRTALGNFTLETNTLETSTCLHIHFMKQ